LFSNFSLENEISKIKLQIPLIELMKNKQFKTPILKMLQIDSDSSAVDTINLQEEKHTIMFGPHIDGKESVIAPFYVSLNVHDKILHNCLLDSGASHNLMPRIVMDELGLEITKPFHDLYSFDSRKVHCLGVIKDLVVNLTQLPMKSVVMDVVVADIPPKFGMLLSRSWSKKLGGTLQMDLSFATIPVFGGEQMRLYSESQLAYIISDPQNPTNHPIYAVQENMDSCILQLNEDYVSPVLKQNKISEQRSSNGNGNLWQMWFDGASSTEGSGAGIVIVSPS